MLCMPFSFLAPKDLWCIIPPLHRRGGGMLFYLCPSFRPSVQDIFQLFCNYWWQKSYILSQASYRYELWANAHLWYPRNVYKNQPSRQTGSRNLTGPKTLPTIWHTYMKLVTKYKISAINSCKIVEQYLGRTDGRTDRGKTTYPHPSGGAGV
jgi:hypothetical protein